MTSSHSREISERTMMLILLTLGLLPLVGQEIFGSWAPEDLGLGALLLIFAGGSLLEDLIRPRR